MTIDELKSLLSRFRIRPDKHLGQNFLLSEEVLDQIVAAANLIRSDTVLEIGPGLGFLTRRLAELAGEVISIEKDRKLYPALRKIFRNYKNTKIIHADALSLMSEGFLGSSVFSFLRHYKVVANIPYYLTGKVLQDFLTAEKKPSLMVLLLQKEVAQRIVARPGEMSILSVSVQFYADPEIIAYVPKESFYPIPEVDSAIVRITPHPFSLSPRERVRGEDEGKFFQLIKIGFSNKRKQLQNNLATFVPLPQSLPLVEGKAAEKKFLPLDGGGKVGVKIDYKNLLSSLGLNPLARAQDLSMEDWARLYRKIFPSLDGRG